MGCAVIVADAFDTRATVSSIPRNLCMHAANAEVSICDDEESLLDRTGSPLLLNEEKKGKRPRFDASVSSRCSWSSGWKTWLWEGGY